MNRDERQSEAIETERATGRILLWLALGALCGFALLVFALWWIAGKVVGL